MPTPPRNIPTPPTTIPTEENLKKSYLYARRVEHRQLQNWASIIGCSVGSSPFTYLGEPIGGTPKRRNFWQPLLDKVDKRLASWKDRCLNTTWSAKLIKATVNNLPSYWFNLYKKFKRICAQMERRDFLWANKKLHLMKWSKVCLPKNRGGLGLTDIKRYNQAMLGKWGWKWQTKRGKL